MKRYYLLFLGITLMVTTAFGQYPANFSWNKYVTSPPDQLRQGPCFTFAAVGTVESMHNLYFGTGIMDLSEREVYSCGNGNGSAVSSLAGALQYINSNGVTTATCIPYPVGQCSENDSDNGPNSIVLQPCATLQQQLANCSFKRRVKAGYEDVSASIRAGTESIKAVLAIKGPIMIAIDPAILHQGAMHAYVLFGWATVNGQLNWILRDSWPCHPGNIQVNAAALNLDGIFNSSTNYKGYVINQVTEERYDNGWYNANLPIQPFELEPQNQLVQIVPPSSSCYGEGTYTLSGLDKVSGVLVGWSLQSSYEYFSTAAVSSSGVVTGNGYGVIVTATFRRPNGLVEKVSKNIGVLGLPARVDKTADWCPTTSQREIHLSVNTPGVAGRTYTYAMNFPSISNGYVFNYGSSAVFVSTVTQSVSYSVTVTCQKTTAPNCPISNSFTTYVLALPCGGYYRAATDANAGVEMPANNDTENVVFPNPASHYLTIHPIGTTENNVTIINAFGNTVHSLRISATADIDISAIPRGMYLVQLTAPGANSQNQIKRVKVVFE